MSKTTKEAGAVSIVIAWADEDAVIAKEGRVDLGERHQFRAVIVGKSAMWLNRGTAEDVAKAEAYAARENGSEDYDGSRYVPRGETVRRMHVFVYPVTEKDPMGRAKRDVCNNRRAA